MKDSKGASLGVPRFEICSVATSAEVIVYPVHPVSGFYFSHIT